MAPWSISAVRNGDVQEPSQVPTKTLAAEKILSEAWTRHADSKSGLSNNGRKPAAYRPCIGLSRFQYGDGEYQASVAALQKYHEDQAENEPLPEMLQLVQTTRTLARTARHGFMAGRPAEPEQISLASLRRRHSTGAQQLTSRVYNSTGGGGGGGEDREPNEAGVQEFSRSESESDNDSDDSGGIMAASIGSDRGDSDGTPLLLSTLSCGGGGGASCQAAPSSRQSNPTGFGGNSPSLEGIYRLQGRFSTIEPVLYESRSTSGGIGASSNEAGGDLTFRQAAPVHRISGVLATGVGASASGGSTFSMHPPTFRRGSACNLTNSSDVANGLSSSPPREPCSSTTHEAGQLDRVSQMLQDLRLAKRHSPSSVAAASVITPFGMSRQRRKSCISGGGEAMEGGGGDRHERHCSGLGQAGDGGDTVPRYIAMRRESRAQLNSQSHSPLHLQVTSSPSSSASATASPLQAILSTEALPYIRQASHGPSALELGILEFTEDELLPASLSTRSPLGAATAPISPTGLISSSPPPPPLPAAAVAALPHQANSCWPGQMPQQLSAIAADIAAAAVAVASGTSSAAAPSARSPVVPFRSKTQIMAAPPPAPPRASSGSPLSGWTSKQLMRQACQPATATATEVTAFPHAVHFAEESTSTVLTRGSESSIGSLTYGGPGGTDDGAQTGSGASGHRFQVTGSVGIGPFVPPLVSEDSVHQQSSFGVSGIRGVSRLFGAIFNGQR